MREGNWADIVVFDPQTVQDTASYKDPHHYPNGIPYVLVNGVVVLTNGQHRGVKAGAVAVGILPPYRANLRTPTALSVSRLDAPFRGRGP